MSSDKRPATCECGCTSCRMAKNEIPTSPGSVAQHCRIVSMGCYVS